MDAEGNIAIAQGLLDFVIKYDYVENVEPQVDFPRYVAVIVGNDVLLTPEDSEYLTRIGHLSYSITYPELKFPDLVPDIKGSLFKSFAIGLGVGAAAATIVAIVIVVSN
jgi:hypothetical protein